MYMQDERSHPQIKDVANPSSINKNMQTDQSYMQQKKRDPNNDDANSRRTSQLLQTDRPSQTNLRNSLGNNIRYPTQFSRPLRSESGPVLESTGFKTDLVKSYSTDKPKDFPLIMQTNASFLSDKRSNSVADQGSQTNLKNDIHALGNIRYPTQFSKPLHAESGPEKCCMCSQSKSQSSIPSNTVLETAQNKCYSTKSVPNVSVRSDKSKPYCNVDIVTAFYSFTSETAPKDTCNMVTPSCQIAQSTCAQPVAEQSSNNPTKFYCLDLSCDTAQNRSTQASVPNSSYYFNLNSDVSLESGKFICKAAKSTETKSEALRTEYKSVFTSTHALPEQSSKNLTKYYSLDPSGNASEAPWALPSSSRYYALSSEATGNSQNNMTAYCSVNTAKSNEEKSKALRSACNVFRTKCSPQFIEDKNISCRSENTSYFDADNSTIVTSMKSCGVYESEESDASEMNPSKKYSFGCADKTSSRSQSVMAKVTCLCSPEEKAKLGMLGSGVSAGPPFVRVKESSMTCDIVPADPILVSRRANNDEFCECRSTSDLSESEKANKQVTESQDANTDRVIWFRSAVSTDLIPAKVTKTFPKGQDFEDGQESCYQSSNSKDFAMRQSQALKCYCSKELETAPTEYQSAQSRSISKNGVSAESVGVVMDCNNRDCFVEDPATQQPELPVGDEMTCDNNIDDCPAKGAKEQQQTLNYCRVENAETGYNSCRSDCSLPVSPKERIIAMLDALSNTNDKSQCRSANIQQLFRELTMLLRDGDNKEDKELTCCTYEECMEAVAAGKSTTKSQSSPQPKTKEQKENTECLDQLEKYLDKCFPLKKSRPPLPEIVAFERDPNFDPYAKPKDPDIYRPSKKSDLLSDNTSDKYYSCSKSTDTPESPDTMLADTEAPDGNFEGETKAKENEIDVDSALAESKQQEIKSEPDNTLGKEKSSVDDELCLLTDRERLLCEYIMRRMNAMCEVEEEDFEEQKCDKGRCPPTKPCLCCHCKAMICDNQCKTVTKTLDAVRHDPVAETKFFIDSILCDMHAMDHVMAKNHLKPKRPMISPCMGNGPGESFPVTISNVSSLGCRALYVRWQLEDCTAIGGYEIYVDGHLTNRFYNYRHEAGVVPNVDVTTGHQVILRAQAVGQEFAGDERCRGILSHPHPEMLVGARRPWKPSVFYYEP